MFRIMCRVSGGVTGTREGLLMSKGIVRDFETKAEAEAEARRFNEQMNGNPHRVADFRYWVVEAKWAATEAYADKLTAKLLADDEREA